MRRRLLFALVVLGLPGALHLPAADAGSTGNVRSGGQTVAHRSGGRALSHEPAARALHFRTGYVAGEPTLGITKDGSIFLAAHGAPTDNQVLRSDDDGSTWEVVSPQLAGVNDHVLSLDPYLYVDEGTSRVFDIDLTVFCSYLSFSDNTGESWTSNPLACGRPINDHQTLFAGAPVQSTTAGYPHVVYYCWNDVVMSSCTKSLDGGISFVPTGSPAFVGVSTDEAEPTRCGGLTGHGVATPRGAVLIPKEHCGQAWLAISEDEGATWRRVQVSNAGTHRYGSDPSVAVDRAGTIYYLWVGRDRLPYLAASRDVGRTWSRPLMVAAPGVKETYLATLAVGRRSRVALAYYGSTNSPFADCEPPACGQLDYGHTTWNGYLAYSTNVLGHDPVFVSAPVNDPRDPLKVGACGPSGPCGAVLDFIDVVIAPDGSPWASFVDAFPGRDSSTVEDEGIAARFVRAPPLR